MSVIQSTLALNPVMFKKEALKTWRQEEERENKGGTGWVMEGRRLQQLEMISI